MWTPPRDAVVPPPPWRKIAIGAVLVLIVLAGAAALIVPEIEESKDERSAAERRSDAAYEAAKERELARESRVQTASGIRPDVALSPVAERRLLVRQLERAITRDARARVRRGNLKGPIIRTECKINPPSRRPLERDLSVRRMDYDCLAIRSHGAERQFVVGHSFDAVVDYARYRFKWAMACLVPGEGSAREKC